MQICSLENKDINCLRWPNEYISQVSLPTTRAEWCDRLGSGVSSTRPSLSSYPHSRVRVTLSQGADRDISLGVWVDGTFQRGVSMFGWDNVETYIGNIQCGVPLCLVQSLVQVGERSPPYSQFRPSHCH